MKNFLFLFVFLLSCSNMKSDLEFELNSDAGRDSFVAAVDCTQDASISCVVCPDLCNSSDTDNCSIEGNCACGLGAPCLTPGSDCKFGKCFDVDLDGPPCEFDPECDPGTLCVEAHCSPASCIPEVCDGVDNDCNNIIDDVYGSPLSRFCYTGPVSLEIISPCRDGVQVCAQGSWGDCIGEITPREELGVLACNGIDENCDGCPDSNLTDGICEERPRRIFDIVFAVDVSGSMTSVMSAVKAVARNLSATYSGVSSIKFGLVVFPKTYNEAHIEQALDEYSLFVSAVDAMTLGGGGNEGNIDVLYELFTTDATLLPIGWRVGSTRVVIVFTDEVPQSYRADRGLGPNLTPTDACAAVTPGSVVYYFTASEFLGHYAPCVTTALLSEDPAMMQSMVEGVLDEACL